MFNSRRLARPDIAAKGRNHARHFVMTTANLFLLTTGKFYRRDLTRSCRCRDEVIRGHGRGGCAGARCQCRCRCAALGPVRTGCDDCGSGLRQRRRWLGQVDRSASGALVWPDRSRLLPTAVVLGGLYHLAMTMHSQRDRPENSDWPTNAAGSICLRVAVSRIQTRGWSSD